MNAREFRELPRNYKDDDERTLQVLEAFQYGYTENPISAAMLSNCVMRGFMDMDCELTDAGRAKLAELRQKKGQGE